MDNGKRHPVASDWQRPEVAIRFRIVAGPNRILRIILDNDKNGSAAVESIAHELQHALEVLSHRDVTNGAAMHGLFERIGVWRNYSFETYDAIKVGEDVRSELRRQRSLQVK